MIVGKIGIVGDPEPTFVVRPCRTKCVAEFVPALQQAFAGEFAGDHEGFVVLNGVEIGAVGERGAKTVRRPASN